LQILDPGGKRVSKLVKKRTPVWAGLVSAFSIIGIIIIGSFSVPMAFGAGGTSDPQPSPPSNSSSPGPTTAVPKTTVVVISPIPATTSTSTIVRPSTQVPSTPTPSSVLASVPPSLTPKPTISFGSLEVHCSADVSVYLGDKLSGMTDRSGNYSIGNLLPDTYTIKLSKGGNKDWSKQVTITAGQKSVIYAYLEVGSGPETTRSETLASDSAGLYGTLEVHTFGDSNIFVESEFGGTTDHYSGVATVSGLLPGTYSVRLTHSGNKDWNKKVTIGTGQKTTIYSYMEVGSGPETTRSEVISPGSSGQYGTLEVHTLGDSGIYIANEFGGTTDHYSGVTTTNGLLPGTYTVKLTHAGNKDWNKQVTIATGQKSVIYAYLEVGSGPETTRSETLAPDSVGLYGTLEVHTSGDSSIYIANEFGGTTDHYSGVATVSGLLPGTYSVRLTHSGNKEWNKQVSIATGQKTVIYAYLEPGSGAETTRSEVISPGSSGQYGSLEVRASGDARIYIGGEYSGAADHYSGVATVNGLLPGSFTLKITLSGYQDWNGQVNISTGQTTKIAATMVKQ
jgi:hypothetical protein